MTESKAVLEERLAQVARIKDFTTEWRVAAPDAGHTSVLGDTLVCSGTVKNASENDWPIAIDGRQCLRVGAELHLKGQGKKLVVGRCALSRELFRAGEEKPFRIELPLSRQLEPGNCRLQIDLVYESVCWFKGKGAKPAEVEVTLVAAPTPSKDAPPLYILCSVQRNGSTFLCETLRKTGIAGNPGEHLLFFDRRKDDITDDEALLERIQRLREEQASENGVYGLKLMWSTAKLLFERMKQIPRFAGKSEHEILTELYGNVRYIYLERYDKVAQAVSSVKLNQRNASGMRLSHVKTNEELGMVRKVQCTYGYEEVDKAYAQVCAHYAQWESFFERNEIAPLRITHEDFVTRLGENVHRILDYLDIPGRETVVVAKPDLLRQADASSAEWAAKYLVEKELRAEKEAPSEGSAL